MNPVYQPQTCSLSSMHHTPNSHQEFVSRVISVTGNYTMCSYKIIIMFIKYLPTIFISYLHTLLLYATLLLLSMSCTLCAILSLAPFTFSTSVRFFSSYNYVIHRLHKTVTLKHIPINDCILFRMTSILASHIDYIKGLVVTVSRTMITIAV